MIESFCKQTLHVQEIVLIELGWRAEQCREAVRDLRGINAKGAITIRDAAKSWKDATMKMRT